MNLSKVILINIKITQAYIQIYNSNNLIKIFKDDSKIQSLIKKLTPKINSLYLLLNSVY